MAKVNVAAPPTTHVRRAGRQYAVRDATGALRHTGTTKRAALAPYKGRVLRAQRERRDSKPMTVKRQTLWRYLIRRGWTCTLEVTNATPITTL